MRRFPNDDDDDDDESGERRASSVPFRAFVALRWPSVLFKWHCGKWQVVASGTVASTSRSDEDYLLP